MMSLKAPETLLFLFASNSYTPSDLVMSNVEVLRATVPGSLICQ